METHVRDAIQNFVALYTAFEVDQELCKKMLRDLTVRQMVGVLSAGFGYSAALARHIESQNDMEPGEMIRRFAYQAAADDDLTGEGF